MSALSALPAPPPIPAGERFIVLGGIAIDPWVCADEIFKMDRAETVRWIARGEFKAVSRIIGFDLQKGTCRDATGEIVREVMIRWADEGESLSEWQFEFVELHVGIPAARSFLCGRAA